MAPNAADFMTTFIHEATSCGLLLSSAIKDRERPQPITKGLQKGAKANSHPTQNPVLSHLRFIPNPRFCFDIHNMPGAACPQRLTTARDGQADEPPKLGERELVVRAGDPATGS